MNKNERVKHWIFDWKEERLIVVVLLIFLVTPNLFNLTGRIESLFENTSVDFDNVKYYVLMKLGNIISGVIIALFILFKFIRNYTKDKVVNRGNLYHEHFYFAYWICSKVLGYRKCSLLNVPIYMQFKLVINDTFDGYVVESDDAYRIIDTEKIMVDIPDEILTSTVNLVLIDTYQIHRGMLPASTSRLNSIYISRYCNDEVRSYSKAFCEKIVEVVRKLPDNVTGINLYATTNPKHTSWIAKNVFKLAGRCNITSLKVYPQYHDRNWNFAEKGKKIF